MEYLSTLEQVVRDAAKGTKETTASGSSCARPIAHLFFGFNFAVQSYCG
jgi:hypothetical protein